MSTRNGAASLARFIGLALPLLGSFGTTTFRGESDEAPQAALPLVPFAGGGGKDFV